MKRDTSTPDTHDQDTEVSGTVNGIRPQGSVIEPVARVGGVPVVTGLTGYDGHYPVQFSDETDEMFAGRVAQFEASLASARRGQAGGITLEQEIAALKAKYDADVATIKAAHKLNTPTSNSTPQASRVVKSKDGSTRGVDADYELEDGEEFV